MTEGGTDRGFTLMELLIVLAIMGLLISIALPNMMQQRVRAARAEAMTHMSALASSEHTFYAENGVFTDDLSKVDWTLTGSPSYMYGFTTDTFPAPSGKNDTSELGAAGIGDFSTRKMVDSFGILLSETDLPADARVDRGSFRIGTVGNVDMDPTLDRWTLDRDGTLTNTTDDLTN